jgi:phage gp29-like protein
MQTIIRQDARSRWTGAVARNFDPARVESTLRGALSGNLVAQWELFDLMEDTSPRIQKNLNQRKLAVLNYVREIEPWEEDGEVETEEAKHRAKVISNALWKMRPAADEDQNGFDATIYDILDAVGKGVTLLEIDWEHRDAGKLGTIAAPKCTRWIHPRYYGYPNQSSWLGLNVSEIKSAKEESRNAGSQNSFPDFLSSSLIPVDGTYARIPADKFLVCVRKSRSGHPAGTALLRSIAFWWAASNFTQEWFLNLAQVFGLPIRWANYDPNIPGLVDQVADMLENMGSAAWGAFPTGTTIELKEAGKAGTDNPQIALLDRADKQYDLLILGQSGTTEVAGPGKGGGSLAANKVLEGVEERIVAADATFVMRIFNEQLIPMIERLNFGDNTLTPELCLELPTVEDVTGLITSYKEGTEAGVITPNKEDEAHIRKKLSLPAMSAEVEADWAGSGGTRRAATSQPGNPSSIINPPPSPETAVQAHARAQSEATTKLIDNTLENLTGVESKWLGGVRPFFHNLIALAQSDRVSDADFVQALAKAQKEMPDLFAKLKPEHLAEALSDAMSSAVVNGAVRASMDRRKAVAK